MARFSFVKIVVRNVAAMERCYVEGLGFAVQNRIDADDFNEGCAAERNGKVS